MARIVVADYDPAWKEAFAAERERIRPAVGAAAVEHIGSTAVPGLPAKPIIDIVVGTEAPTACIEPLLALGYERAEWGDFGASDGAALNHSRHASEWQITTSSRFARRTAAHSS